MINRLHYAIAAIIFLNPESTEVEVFTGNDEDSKLLGFKVSKVTSDGSVTLFLSKAKWEDLETMAKDFYSFFEAIRKTFLERVISTGNVDYLDIKECADPRELTNVLSPQVVDKLTNQVRESAASLCR